MAFLPTTIRIQDSVLIDFDLLYHGMVVLYSQIHSSGMPSVVPRHADWFSLENASMESLVSEADQRVVSPN